MADAGTLGALIRDFYRARRAASRSGDLDGLGAFIDAGVRWIEPDVGDHMGVLDGRDAVIDMIGRALETTGGTFDLTVADTIETSTHVAATIDWTAEKGGRTIAGRELAVYEIRHGRIASAWFHAANIADDEEFWGNS